ncbi:hypothetical protein V1477_008943 [Vespula maculifrons]|uniref:Uncharacterized protein n=1 Tax=Vespula maculifrons TaxID=7453 RepID=A0ABD2CEG1_VESMC
MLQTIKSFISNFFLEVLEIGFFSFDITYRSQGAILCPSSVSAVITFSTDFIQICFQSCMAFYRRWRSKGIVNFPQCLDYHLGSLNLCLSLTRK